ncbi:MAG: hypothetical protein C0467_30845 [Planctomycetaceae bacterium]|nr:hypothetical protein [Planctomycetaceae bacterium]
MAGKFMRRAAMVDSVKTEQAVNARRRRSGLTRHPIRGYACGCPDEGCGAFYVIDTTKVIPTAPECRALLTAHNRSLKSSDTVR